MRLPIPRGVRPLADYEVDRPEVYARQRVQPTGTNRPRTWLLLALAIGSTGPPVGSHPPWFLARPARIPDMAWDGRDETNRFGGYSEGETPGPIPNPEVKPSSADGTALVTGWESRSPPRHRGRRAPAESRGPSSFPSTFLRREPSPSPTRQ